MRVFNSRMNCAAACGLSSARSTICTNADPTITPSANLTHLAGLFRRGYPKPDRDRRRGRSAEPARQTRPIRSANCDRAPVTPVNGYEIDEARAFSATNFTRSSVEVGARK